MINEENNSIVYPTIEDFYNMVELLRTFKEQFAEDIPPFETRYPDRLESILAQLEANYFGEELYKGILEKAVILFYLLNKSHPFLNGNKRTAILALFEFLANNVQELFISNDSIFNDDIYEMAIRTAESKPEDFESIKDYLRKEIDLFIIEY